MCQVYVCFSTTFWKCLLLCYDIVTTYAEDDIATVFWWSFSGDEWSWSLLTLRSDVLLWLVDVQLLLSVQLHPCPFALIFPRRSVEARLSGCCDGVLGLCYAAGIFIVILDCLKGGFTCLLYEIISSFCQCLCFRLRGLWQLELGNDLRDRDVSPFCRFQRGMSKWDLIRCPSCQVDEWALRLCVHISN